MSSIKKNFAYQMMYEVLALIVPLITSPYIARTIGAEGLGIYSYSYSVAYYFVLFSMLGLKNYGSRAIAQTRDDPIQLNETFSSLLAVHVLVSILCCFVYAGYVISLGKERTYALIQSAYVLSGFFDISWFYFGIEKVKLTAMQSTIIKVLNVICIFIFVRGANDLWKYCVIMAMGTLLGQLILWLPLGRYVRIVRIDAHSVSRHIKPLLILFIPAIAVSLYKYMDKIMIGSLNSKIQLGLYENAEKVINIPITVIAAFGTVMLPRMSNLLCFSDRSVAKRYICISMRYVMCLAFALAFGLAGVGKVFAPVFWGSEFQSAGVIIMGLAITMPFLAFANVIRTQFLIPMERDRQYLNSVITGALINLIINWILIPSMGAIGATIGTIAAEVAVCMIQTWTVRKELEIGAYLRNAAPFLGIGSVMFFAVYIFGLKNAVSIQTLIEQIGMGIIIYSVISIVYLYVVRDSVLVDMIQKIRMQNLFRKKAR